MSDPIDFKKIPVNGKHPSFVKAWQEGQNIVILAHISIPSAPLQNLIKNIIDQGIRVVGAFRVEMPLSPQPLVIYDLSKLPAPLTQPELEDLLRKTGYTGIEVVRA